MEATASTEAISALERLDEKVNKLKLSISKISRLSGKSSGTVSQVLNGKYRGRPEIVSEILVSVEMAESTEVKPTQSAGWLTEGEELIRGILNLTYHYIRFLRRRRSVREWQDIYCAAFCRRTSRRGVHARQ